MAGFDVDDERGKDRGGGGCGDRALRDRPALFDHDIHPVVLAASVCARRLLDALDQADLVSLEQDLCARLLEAAEGSEVTVSGFLVADRDGNTRLCSGLLESSPPQCGGDRIDLLGFDANSVPNTSTPQSSSEIRTTKWTNSQITVTGIKGVGGLVEVRLSNEN